MLEKNRQDFWGMVGHFRLNKLTELAKQVERSVAHHWGWVPDASAHNGEKCWQIPKDAKSQTKLMNLQTVQICIEILSQALNLACIFN